MKRPFAFICLTFFLLSSCAGAGHYNPPSGAGRIVLMISGKSGPSLYVEHARRLSASGYTVLLHDGNDFPLDRPHACRAMIQEILREAQLSRGAPKGRAAVIGYSLGGAVALACASSMEEEIAGLVVYYPATAFFKDHDGCVERMNVPVLVLQGEDDRFFNCCTVGPIKRISDLAAGLGKQIQLVVYPDAGHGFNLGSFKNTKLDEDSHARTIRALESYFSR